MSRRRRQRGATVRRLQTEPARPPRATNEREPSEATWARLLRERNQ